MPIVLDQLAAALVVGRQKKTQFKYYQLRGLVHTATNYAHLIH